MFFPSLFFLPTRPTISRKNASELLRAKTTSSCEQMLWQSSQIRSASRSQGSSPHTAADRAPGASVTILARQKPIVSVVPDARTYNPNAKVTEEAETLANILVAVFPFSRVDEGIEQALLRDAQKHHFAELMTHIDTFAKDCIDCAGKCNAWVSRIAGEIPGACGLPPFIPNRT